MKKQIKKTITPVKAEKLVAELFTELEVTQGNRVVEIITNETPVEISDILNRLHDLGYPERYKGLLSDYRLANNVVEYVDSERRKWQHTENHANAQRARRKNEKTME